MELNQFDYTRNPYTSSKVYDIYPLSRDGFSQYISSDSYTHKYIKNKFDADILEKAYGIETSRPNNTQQNFYNSSDKLNRNYETFQNQTNQNNNSNNKHNITETYKEKHEILENKNIETLKSELLPNKFNNNNTNFSKTTNDFNKTENNKDINFEHANINNYNNNNNSEDFHSQIKRNCYSSYNRISNKKTDLSKLNYTSSRGNKNNLDKFLSMKKNLNIKHNTKDSMRWDTNYPSNIEFLKKNQNLFFDFDPQEENLNLSRKKKHDGFESFNIPRLENIQTDASKPAYQYTQRLVKSCVGKRKENSTNNLWSYQSNLANNNKEIQENNGQMIVEKIKEENKKLKHILNTQTSKDFLKRGNMPKISYVALQPKLVIKKFGLGGEGKFLGGKYNPENFQTGRGNEANRRNYFGGLYMN